MKNQQLTIPTQDIQSFQFSSQEVRTEIINNEVWFCLADITEILNIQRGSRVVERLNPKGVRKTYTLTDGGQQELLFINESNLYKLIFRSNKPEARAFEDWVTGEVLPTIRKTGSYSAHDDIITEQALKGTKAFIVRVSVEEPAKSKGMTLVHRQFKATVYITEEQAPHEISTQISHMLYVHHKK